MRVAKLLVMTCAVAAGSPMTPAVAQTDFSGKTIKLSVNFPAGGPSDTLARQIAPFIATRIPGKPAMVTENMPGAAGVLGANHMFNLAKPDGLTIGFAVGITTPGLVGGTNVRFDPEKFRWLGAIPQTQVLYARNELKIAEPMDLLKPALPLVLGEAGVGSVAGIANRLFLGMIGAKYKHVTGYRGQADSRLALERGEINLDNAGIVDFLSRRETILKEGLYRPVAQRGELNVDGSFRRNRLLPAIPTMIEVIEKQYPAAKHKPEFAAYRILAGSFAVHFGLVLPPKTDDATVSVLRKAVSEALEDSSTRASIESKLMYSYDFVDGATAEKILAKLRAEWTAQPETRRIIQSISGGK